MKAGDVEGEHLFTISSDTPAGLRRRAVELSRFAETASNEDAAELSCALNCFGEHRRFRRAFAYRTIDDLATIGRSVVDVDPLPRTEAIIFLLSSGGFPLRPLIDRLSDEYALFRGHYRACVEEWPGPPDDERLQRFGLQLGLFRLLESLGVTAARLLGGGVGRHVIATVRGKQTLAEALRSAAGSREEPAPADLAERIAAGIRSDHALGRRLYLELGPEGALSSALRQIRKPDDDYEVMAVSGSGVAPILAALYERSYPIAWDRVHQARCVPRPQRRDEGDFPLSHGQKRLWMIHQAGAAPGLYTMSAAAVVHGAFNVSALARAFRALVARHETLRTSFRERSGEPRQRVAAMQDLDPSWLVINDKPLAPEQARGLAQRQALQAFDLAHDAPLRVRVSRLTDGSHLLSLSMHHIAGDAWSVRVLVGELSLLYAAYSRGEPDPLAPPVTQYKDYAIRQSLMLRSGKLGEHREYWKEKLSDTPPLLDLPSDHPRPLAKTYSGALLSREIDSSLMAAFAALCGRHGASLFAGCVALVKALLFRYSRQKDLAVGTLVAGRSHKRLEDQVGFYVNTLVLRDAVAGSDRFVDLLARVKATTTEAFEHQEYPFDCIVEDLGGASDPGRHPLFDVLVEMLEPDADLPLAGCQVSMLEWAPSLCKFDLAWGFMRDAERALMRIGYSTDLFEEPRVQRMAAHFCNLLRAVVSDPEVRISDADLLEPAERSRILVTFNEQDQAEAIDLTLIDLFESQASRTPDAAALTFAGRTLSYSALNERANHVAHSLIELRVQRDEPVAILLDRSEATVIAILAVLKAGAAYLPIDPGEPDARMIRALTDAGCRAVITESQHAARLDCVCAALDISELLVRPAVTMSPPRADIDPENLAYVIFTSGSTGRPNGVMMSHRSVLKFVRGLRERISMPLERPMSIALLASFSFDASVQQIFSALLYGHCLHVLPDSVKKSPPDLWAYFQANRVDLADCTPSLFSLMVHGLNGAPPAALHLLVGGEVLPQEVIRRFYGEKDAGQVRISNVYGPTEACVDATLHAVASDCLSPDKSCPIGRPLGDSRIYILDEQLQPVPIGVQGEIYIAGGKLARGYIRNPRLTAERFVPSLFAPGERMYRTGDQGCFQPDGSIQFFGRNDDQVKIRGHRIELGEVEEALRCAPGVAEAAVVAEGAPDHKELIALVRTKGPFDAAALRRALHGSVPLYMVPSRFVPIDAFPLTTSGKIDRRALPALVRAPSETGRTHVPPQGPLQRLMVTIWEEVLRAQPIGITDHFFELGGDSIRGIQFVSRLSAAGFQCDLRRLFEHPTIASLSGHVTAAGLALREAATGPVPLTPLQATFFERSTRADPPFTQTVLLSSKGRLERAVLERALRLLADHHDVLRSRFVREDGQVVQLLREPGSFDISLEELLLPNDAAADSAWLHPHLERFSARLDVENGPLVVPVILRRPEGDALLIIAHHLIIDGVSWRILMEDLSMAYRALLEGNPPRLPPRTDSWKTWATRLASYGQSAHASADLAFWRGLDTSGLPPFLHASDNDGVGAPLSSREITLSRVETHDLQTGTNHAYNTRIHDVLITALSRALCAWHGGSRTMIAVESHGREGEFFGDLDVSRTLGWFTAIYPLIIDLSESQDLGRQVVTVKEAIRNIPESGVTYGLLQKTRGSELVVLPSPAISFNYLGVVDLDASDDLFSVDLAPTRGARSLRSATASPLALESIIEGGRLRCEAVFDARLFDPDRVTELLRLIQANLSDVIAHCKGRRVSERSPADLSYRGLTQAEYRDVLREAGARTSDITDICALSPLQEGFLFHHVYDRKSTEYIQQLSVRLAGPLDRTLAEESLRRLCEAYDVLRTAFVHTAFKRPLQVVLKERDVELTIVDEPPSPADMCEARLSERRAADMQRPFDLAHGALMRVTLVRLDETEHELIWTFPHIILDGFSAGRLFRLFLDTHDKLSLGQRPDFPAARSYAEHVRWLERQDRASAVQHFTSTLRGYEQTAKVPSYRRAAKDSARHEVYTFTLDPRRTAALHAFAARHGVTVNTLTHVAWGVVLARYNDTRDVVFGAAVSIRESAFDDTPGLFINTLPVRITFGVETTIPSLLRDVQENALAARAHSWLALHEIQALSPLRAQIFDHVLIFENYPLDEGLRDTRRRTRIDRVMVVERTHYSFSMTVTPGEELSFTLRYDEAAHDTAQMRQIEGHLRQCFEALTDPRSTSVATINILAPDEVRALRSLNGPGSDASPRTALELFDEQESVGPERVAVVYGGAAMTYRELRATSDRLAGLLRRRGLRADETVALLLPRSEQLIVGMLAVLRAGGAFVPVDPTHPKKRISHILSDAGARVILTCSALLPAAREAGDIDAICLDQMSEDVQEDWPAAEPDHLAYIMYTSGSTGAPKGVMITHRNLASFARNLVERFGMTGADRILATTTVSFDISLLELVCALCSGVSVEVASQELLDDPTKLLDRITSGAVSILQLTPTRLGQLLELEDLRCLRRLRVVLVGGEELPKSLSEKLAALPAPAIFNVYGPTETTIWSTSAHINGGRSGIGSPLLGEEVYVLSSDGHLTPSGVLGEIAIGGAGVGRGYHRRPDLTAARFIPHPFIAGERVYRTGDRGRWLATGDLEFVGRNDRQVKVRGHRIECGEIEAHLSQHDGIEAAVVVARHTAASGGTELIAYLKARRGLDVGSLRSFLRARVPDAMVPSHFVFLDAFPLTPNQKIDRNALPEPTSAADRAPFAAPSTDVERALAAIFREALGAGDVGLFDDFFALGGHSLKATRVIGRIRRDLSVDIELRELFLHPTVAELAALVAGLPKRDGDRIEAIASAESYPLSHAQRRMWVLHQIDSSGVTYSMPVALRLRGDLDIAALSRAFEAVIARHEALRTTLTLIGGEPRQRVLEGARPPSLRVTPYDGDFAAYIDHAIAQPFELLDQPLFRAELLDRGAGDYLLYINMHHAISDGWSTAVLAKEVCRLYDAFSQGRNTPLAPLRIQYKDYVAWQARLLDGEVGRVARAYWLDKLSAPLPEGDLPTDHPRPLVRTYQGKRFEYAIDASLAGALRSLSGRHGTTLFITLTAAIKALLVRYTGGEDIIVGTPVAGRVHAELEDQVGLYVNTLALRSLVRRHDRLVDVLSAVKATVTEAFAHQSYPFDKLVDELHLKRDLGRSPLFDVMVSLWDAADTALDMRGVEVTPVGIPTYGSKADLTFNFTESGDYIAASIDYNVDLFEERRVRLMSAHVVAMLRAFVNDAAAPVWSAEIVREPELREILAASRREALAGPEERTLAAAFAEQAARSPNRDAIVCQGRRMTYAELDAASQSICAHLTEQFDIHPDDVVAVSVNRDEWAIAIMLGILRAGGAYLPIDPESPRERVRGMLAGSGARLVISARSIEAPDLPVVLAEELIGATRRDPRPGPANAALTDRHLAYVLFTSGSTGRPKGAAIDHRAVLSLVRALEEEVYEGVPDGARVAILASFVFDASVQQIYPALLGGRTLFIVPEQTKRDPRELPRFLADHAITVADCTPTLLSILLENPGVASPLLRMIAGGEALPPHEVERFYEAHPDARAKLVNVYGLTECCVDSTLHVAPRAIGERGNVPIGHPMRNTSVYVLDDAMQLAPIGVPGEIYIGGDGLGRGYITQPGWTADRFVPSAFGSGERLFRTGDRGRLRVDGAIEFLGRNDHQVKIRGHRIECGEIEQTILRRINAVTKVAVDARGVGGERELVAFMETRTAVHAAELRDRLADALPPYMIPARFVILDRLPLLPSGKIDRRALPDPRGLEVQTGTAFEPATNEMEQRLIGIWSQVLGREGIGVRDHFFDLGGDSIKAVQIVSHLYRGGLACALRDIFLHPTIAALSPHVSPLQSRVDQRLVTGLVPLTPIQRWFFEEMRPARDHFNQSVLLTARQRLDVASLEASFHALIRHHDMLRSVFESSDGDVRQRVLAAVPFTLGVVDLSAEPDPAVAVRSYQREHRSDFDLARGPLLRAVVLRLRGADRLLIEIHHLVVDGVSWRILLEDLSTAYRQALAREAIVLPMKTSSFQAWAEALVRRAEIDPLRLGRDVWREAGAASSTLSPLIEPSAERGDYHTRTETIRFTAEETEALLTRVHRAYSTAMDDILLSALARALSRWLGRPKTVVFVESHGRASLELEVSRTLGWFTTMYPFVLDSSRDDIGYQIKSVKEALRRVPDNGAGYGLLRYLKHESYGPDARACLSFNYLGQFDAQVPGGLFLLTDEAATSPQSSSAPPPSELAINGVVIENRLRIAVTYVAARFRPATVVALLDAYAHALREVITHCQERREAERTPSDFTHSELSLDELDELVEGLNIDA